jgi:penicillin-binding protein 1A
VDAAARLYFGISARHVSLWQAAMLAGLPRAPSRFNPRADPKAAAARTREVLGAMVAAGALSPDQAAAADAQIPATYRHPGAGWFADWAAAQAENLVPEGTDATIRSTLDRATQSVAETRLAAILDGPGRRAGAGEGAVVVLDAETGAVRAMVGGRIYEPGAYNRATLARRQPGSAFKPFVWLTALEHGMRPDDTVQDAPLHIGAWSPQNFEPGFRGEVTLEQALADSINTAAVRLELQSGGPQAVAATAHRLGIAEKLPDVPALALGTGEVGLLELTAAYAPFFNGGKRITPHGIESAFINHHPEPIPEPEPTAIVNPDIAAMMARMLQAVVTTGTGRAAAIQGRLVAGKTGTTQDNRDAWFIGFYAGRLIGIWLGNDGNAPMRHVMGGTLPAALFRQIAVRQ